MLQVEVSLALCRVLLCLYSFVLTCLSHFICLSNFYVILCAVLDVCGLVPERSVDKHYIL